MSLSTLSFPRHPHLGITKLSLEYQSVVDLDFPRNVIYFINIEVSNINVLCKLLNDFLFVILKFYRNKYCNNHKIYDITYYVTQKIKNDF